MNKSSIFVIGIPLFIVGIVVVGVFIFRTMERQQASMATLTQIASDEVPTLSGEVGKPKSGFADTNTSSGVADLSADLRSIEDDGGASDFSALEAEAAKL
ncbi:hypothetical protein KBC80_00750 [Candidatus Woesebacteria bacterium]|jgi:hypothetical protein|nr:hypothetical protein [Candidatus Woesebacteria bacterium]